MSAVSNPRSLHIPIQDRACLNAACELDFAASAPPEYRVNRQQPSLPRVNRPAPRIFAHSIGGPGKPPQGRSPRSCAATQWRTTTMKHAKPLAIAAGAVLAGAALSPSAFAWSNSSNSTTQQNAQQQIKKMDTNNNDQVSRTEFDQYWTQQFQSADTNHDGKLSQQEAQTAAQNMNGGRVASQTSFDHMFRKADSNNDGSISRDEDLAFHNKMFRQADSNNDGKLSVAEVGHALQNPNQSLASL